MAYVFVLESANLFCGDVGPDNDKSLLLETVKIPDMEENVQAFHPGGSYGALEIGGLGLKELMIEFKTVGVDPQTMSQFGVFGAPQQHYTIYGATRNKVDNSAVGIKAIAWGRMRKIASDNFKKGDLFGQSYQISEITHYELYFDSVELFFYDFFSHIWRVNGQNMIGEVNSLLGLAS